METRKHGACNRTKQESFTLTPSHASDEETESQPNGYKVPRALPAQSLCIVLQLLSRYEGIMGDITRSSEPLGQLWEGRVYTASKQRLRFDLGDIAPHSSVY